MVFRPVVSSLCLPIVPSVVSTSTQSGLWVGQGQRVLADRRGMDCSWRLFVYIARADVIVAP